MKNTTKLILSICLFSLAQLALGLFIYAWIKSDLTKSAREGARHNFSRLCDELSTALSSSQDDELSAASSQDDEFSAALSSNQDDELSAASSQGILNQFYHIDPAGNITLNSQNGLFYEVFIYDFENVFIVESDGCIFDLAFETEHFSVGGLLTLGDFRPETVFNDADLSFLEYTFSGERVLVQSKRVLDYLIVAYQNISAEKAMLVSFIQKLCLSFLVNSTIIGGGALIIFGLNKQRESRQISISEGDLKGNGHIIWVDRRGNIKGKKNAHFLSMYRASNISEHYHESTPLAFVLSSGAVFSLSLESHSGEQAHFRCIAMGSGGGYRILAVDETQFILEGKEIAGQVFVEPVTCLKNKRALELDLEKFHKGADQKASLAIFDIKNLERLETLFGVRAKEKLLKLAAEKLREKYESIAKLYFIDEDKFVLLCNEYGEAVKKSLPDFNLTLGAIMRSERIGMQIQSDITFLYIDNTEYFSLSDLLEFSRYIRLNLKGRVSSSVLSEIFTLRKYSHAVGNKKELAVKIIKNRDFSLHYQPQFRVSDGKLVAFESLVRLNDESMPTQDFIMISEGSGYMLELGEQIMLKAFEFASHITEYGVPICINLSPVQLLNNGFTDSFFRSYEKFCLSKRSIALEITETFLMSDVDENIKKLRLIQASGVEIHLDDFGMGYSSLSYLKNIPIDSIKIDKEFVSLIDKDEYSRAICRFIVMVAKQLGKQTIAEGVETKSQLDSLRKIGCDVVQGFYTGKPLEEQDAITLLNNETGERLGTDRKPAIRMRERKEAATYIDEELGEDEQKPAIRTRERKEAATYIDEELGEDEQKPAIRMRVKEAATYIDEELGEV